MSFSVTVNRLIGPLVINAFSGRLIARLLGNKIPHRGLTIDTGSGLVNDSLKAALFFRGYESGEYRFIEKFIHSDIDVVELGGSIGVMSSIIRRKLAPSRKLVTVEADPRLAVLLADNLSRNGLRDGVVITQKAISYSDEPTVTFAQGETSVGGKLAEAGDTRPTFTVPAITLATLIEENGISDYALVSDIEGVEWSMIEGDLDALARARVIVMETHSQGDEAREAGLIDSLVKAGNFTVAGRHGPVLVLTRR